MLERIPDDEPLFLLRAQDKVADDTVFDWAARAKRVGTTRGKLEEAINCADAMSKWPNRKVPD